MSNTAIFMDMSYSVASRYLYIPRGTIRYLNSQEQASIYVKNSADSAYFVILTRSTNLLLFLDPKL